MYEQQVHMSLNFSFYSYANDKYETSVFPSDGFYGTPELAIQTSADFHL